MRTVPVLACAALLLGGTAALAAAGEQATDRQSGRIGGEDRFETAARIAVTGYPDGSDTVHLARHDAFPDALAATALDGPVLVTTPCGPIPEVVLDALDQLGATRVVALGGTGAVADQVLDQATAGERDPALACPGTIPDTASGLELTTRADGDGVDVVVRNTRDTAVEAGRHHVLERRAGAAYDPVDPPVGPFRGDAVVVEPGGELLVAEVGPTVVRGGQPTAVPDGQYRVRYVVEGVELATTFAYPPRR